MLSLIHICVRIPINPEIKKLRIDPGEIPCILDVVSMKLNGKEIHADVLGGNWHMRTKQNFFFETADPQIMVHLETAGELELQLRIMDISQGAAELLGKQLEPVSYTHLDVYKRHNQMWMGAYG